MRITTSIADHDCSPLTHPDVINPVITNKTKGQELLALQQEQKTLWMEFDLQEAIKSCGVAVIVQVIDKQYLEERKKEYIGYNNESIHSLLDHIRT